MKRIDAKVVATRALLGLLAVVIVVVAYKWLTRTEPEHAHEHGEVTIQVQLVKPAKGGLNRLCIQPATVESWESVDLHSEVTGILRQQTVDIYSRVKKGEVLARIDAPDVVEEWKVAKTRVRRAGDKVKAVEARVQTAMARKRGAEKVVAQRQAEKRAAQAMLQFRQVLVERYTSLGPNIDPGVPDEERDRFTAARNKYDAALLAISQAEEDVKARQADIEETEAALEVARADVVVSEKAAEKAKVFVDFTEIKAPFNGVITFRSRTDGAFIRAKETGSRVPLLTVKRTDKFRIVTYVPDVDVPYIRKGDPAKLRVASLGMVLEGKVARRAVSQQESNRLMRTEMDMDNPKGLLRDGMYGEATVYVGDVAKVNPNVVNIPSQCLQDEGQSKERTVYVLESLGSGKYRVHLRQVMAGYNEDKGRLNPKGTKVVDLRVEVLGGLGPHDVLVNGKVAGITEGTMVEAKE